MKKILLGFLITMAIVSSPIVSMADVYNYEFMGIDLSQTQDGFYGLGEEPGYIHDKGKLLPLTKDDPKNQIRVPMAYPMELVNGLSYRVPKGTKVHRHFSDEVRNGVYTGRAMIVDTIIGPEWKAILNVKTGTGWYSGEDVAEFFKYAIISDDQVWRKYHITNTAWFYESWDPEAIRIYGRTADRLYFTLLIFPNEGKRLKKWTGKNIMQGLEVTIMNQAIRFRDGDTEYYGGGWSLKETTDDISGLSIIDEMLPEGWGEDAGFVERESSNWTENLYLQALESKNQEFIAYANEMYLMVNYPSYYWNIEW